MNVSLTTSKLSRIGRSITSFSLLAIAMHLATSAASQNWQRSVDLVPGDLPANSDLGLNVECFGKDIYLCTGSLLMGNAVDAFGFVIIDTLGTVKLKQAYLDVNRPFRSYGHSMAFITDSLETYLVGDRLIGFNAPEKPDYDVFLMKLNSEGDSIWTKYYSSPRREFPRSMSFSPFDSLLYIFGDGGHYVEDEEIYNFVQVVDLEGNLVRERDFIFTDIPYAAYGNAEMYSADSIVSTFFGYSFGTELGHTYVMMVDSDLNILWRRKLHKQQACVPVTRVLHDGNIAVVTCVDTLISPWFNPYVVTVSALNSAGDLVWEISLNSEFIKHASNMIVTKDNNLLLCGYYADDSEWRLKGMVAKISSEGELLWERFYVSPSHPWSEFKFVDIVELEDGDIIVSGNIEDTLADGSIDGNAWVARFDSEGCFKADECGQDILLETVDLHRRRQPIGIYPNPTSGFTNIEIPTEVVRASARIYDQTGQQIQDIELLGGVNSFFIKHPGFYIASIYFEDGTVTSQKFLCH